MIIVIVIITSEAWLKSYGSLVKVASSWALEAETRTTQMWELETPRLAQPPHGAIMSTLQVENLRYWNLLFSLPEKEEKPFVNRAQHPACLPQWHPGCSCSVSRSHELLLSMSRRLLPKV